MKQTPLSDVKDGLSRFLRLATDEEIVITRHGKPAGVLNHRKVKTLVGRVPDWLPHRKLMQSHLAISLVGLASEDDWIDRRLKNDPRFLARIAQAQKSFRAGLGVRIEDVEFDDEPQSDQLRNLQSTEMLTCHNEEGPGMYPGPCF